MPCRELPYRATTGEACAWLAHRTGTPWSLARLVAHGLTPSIWIDCEVVRDGGRDGDGDVDTGGSPPGASGGYAMPLRIAGDTGRLGSAHEVLITIWSNPGSNAGSNGGKLGELGELGEQGGQGTPIVSELRFLKKDLERLAEKLRKRATPA